MLAVTVTTTIIVYCIQEVIPGILVNLYFLALLEICLFRRLYIWVPVGLVAMCLQCQLLYQIFYQMQMAFATREHEIFQYQKLQ